MPKPRSLLGQQTPRFLGTDDPWMRVPGHENVGKPKPKAKDGRNWQQKTRDWLNQKGREYLGPHAESLGLLGMASEFTDAADLRDASKYGGEMGNAVQRGDWWGAAGAAPWMLAASGAAMLPGVSMGAVDNIARPKFVRNLKGEKVPAPTQFYRGTNPGDARRITTGKTDWDGYLFAADNEPAARMYGSSIQQFQAAPDAKILYEGTAEWNKIAGKIRKNENMLEYADRAAKAARAAGYDAAWFQRQGDIGTAIFNPDKFMDVAK